MFSFRPGCAVALAMIAIGAIGHPAFAQSASEAKEMQGDWEISNADRDKICVVRLALQRALGGFKLEFDKPCREAFEVTKEVSAWRIDNDGVHFVDAMGRSLLDLDEVEKGIFEGLRPNDGRYFMQSVVVARAAPAPDHLYGEWQVSRGTDRQLCTITLLNKPAGENLALELKPGCDALVTGFNPTSWRMDGGELVISSANASWRFEEAGQIAWKRIPEGSDPLWLVRQMENPPPDGG